MPDIVEKPAPLPELPRMPERGTEAVVERPKEPEPTPAVEKPVEAPPSVTAPAASPAAPVDPVASNIEKILSEDLYDFYKTMPPDLRDKFKQKGEETVSRLSALVSQINIKAKEVLKLIIAWLKMIPGVSKFFLEQESKIKADKILELHRRTHEQ